MEHQAQKPLLLFEVLLGLLSLTKVMGMHIQ
jgi:hypothetical protein